MTVVYLGYNPSEPRDNNGRWTSGGGGHAKPAVKPASEKEPHEHKQEGVNGFRKIVGNVVTAVKQNYPNLSTAVGSLKKLGSGEKLSSHETHSLVHLGEHIVHIGAHALGGIPGALIASVANAAVNHAISAFHHKEGGDHVTEFAHAVVDGVGHATLPPVKPEHLKPGSHERKQAGGIIRKSADHIAQVMHDAFPDVKPAVAGLTSLLKTGSMSAAQTKAVKGLGVAIVAEGINAMPGGVVVQVAAKVSFSAVSFAVNHFKERKASAQSNPVHAFVKAVGDGVEQAVTAAAHVTHSVELDDEKGFNPSEPRDQAGRWTNGGGSGKKPAAKPFDKKPEAQHEPRKPGETDKEYAKRVVDKEPRPETLPERYSDYFIMDHAVVVPLTKLVSSKSDAENMQGAENGPKRMRAAAQGRLSKRVPITVEPIANSDKYLILDGNGTYSSVKSYGWKALPVIIQQPAPKKGVVYLGRGYNPSEPRDENGRWTSGGGGRGGDRPGREKPAGDKPSNPSSPRPEAVISALVPRPPTAPPVQPTRNPDELFAKSAEALSYLKEWLNQGGGVMSKMGFKTMEGPITEASLRSTPGQGQLYIAPLKGKPRSEEKVRADYDGDWSRLVDVTRATVAVDKITDVKAVVDRLNASGMVLAKAKNRFQNPTPEGYRDLLLNIKAPNGVIMELQVHVKEMTIAKEKGHVLYETIRSVTAKNGKDQSTWPAEDVAKVKTAEKMSVALYSSAWKSALK